MEYAVKLRILSGREVRTLMNVQDVLEAVEEVFVGLGRGTVRHPVKEPMWLNEQKTNMLLAMPAFISERKLAGVKWVNMFKDQRPGYPTCGGTILILNNSDNGQPYALMEATAITTMRTAGGHGAIAAKYLARKNSRVAAIIGCGHEGRAGADALLHLFQLDEIRVFDLSPEALAAFKDHVGDRARVTCGASPREAVSSADIVMTVTTSRRPVVMFEWLPRGSTVIGLYSFYDLDPSASRKADKWVLGSRLSDNHQIVFDPILAEHKLSMDDVYADLGEIVTRQKAGRENDDEIIVYSCLGMGAFDAAVGQMVYRRAVEKNLGIELDLT
ncbi:MAG: hypothetical protein LBP33_10155 [Candidatus Adiutrix sp.]|jgi:ornithine cyclodeaminase/alanine dehydrogenase-like protein (mu-crystallin family)|nr:hypothetical protein [Candidatus Adiutrix sp.]